MKKSNKISKTNILIPLSILLFIIASSILLLSISNKKIPETRSRAANNTHTVCPDNGSGCSFVGGDGIQQAVDQAQNGNTILLQPGRYTRRNPTDDAQIKYRYCMVNTRGKSLTIKGAGATLDGENGGMNSGIPENRAISSIGICDQGGDVTIDSLQIKQTLRPAIFLRNSKAVIKNVTFIDIDSTVIDIWPGSKAIILNNLFAGSAGPGINVLPLAGDAFVKIENNTFYGNGGAGIIFNLCGNSQPTGNVKNNLIVNPGDLFSKPLSGSGIGAECREQEAKVASITAINNFVWKGQSNDGCLGEPDKKSPYTDCVAGEICSGSTVSYPFFIGADEKGTVCVYGEGTTAGDFNTRPNSPITQAGAGYGSGPCANPASSNCTSYVEQQKSEFVLTAPTDIIPTSLPYVSVPPNNIPTNPPYNQPTRIPPNYGKPPITYYLPPTMSFSDPNQPTIPTEKQPLTETFTPTITPTPKPLIDFKKTINNVKNYWDSMVSSFILFTQTILP